MKWISTAIGAVVAISVIPTIVSSVNGLTGEGMALKGTVAGTLLELAPLVFVAGVLAYLFLKTGAKKSAD